jgi:hypothetical protein
MATVEDYQTGEICEMVKMAFILRKHPTDL